MPMILYVVDAFTSRPFSGNPAAVCVLDQPADPAWMQSLALELNLSETAFVHAEADSFGLRWFTPRTEVDLCGHATLASAHIVWELGLVPDSQEARFQTRSGLLTCARRADAIEMNFPACPPIEMAARADLAEVLGIPALWVGSNGMDWLVEVRSADEVRNLRPNLARMASWPVRGVIVTAPGDGSEADFLSRFFAPSVGVPEDPVTGSAHCALGPFWAERWGRTELIGYQASARGGFVGVSCRGDRVVLSGQAVTVLRCELLHPPA